MYVTSFLQITRDLKYDEFDHTGTVIFLLFPQSFATFFDFNNVSPTTKLR